MTTLRSYPEYKPSGIDWLEDIPVHWSSSSLRRVASVAASNVDKHIVEGEIPVLLCNYTDVYYNHHITSDIEFSKGTVTPEELARFQLLPGDVLITKDSETWDDIAVPAVVIDALPNVVCGYHLSRIRPDPMLDGRFLAYWIGSKDGAIHFKVSANGVTRFGLGANAIKSAPVPLPPVDEQRAIADFLDAMDAKITRFIAARRQMIARLEEQKGAIINQAVTRGLDPDVPLKPSGIDWLGDIPAHWEVKRSRFLFREIDLRAPDDSLPRLSMSQRHGMVPTEAVESWRMQSESSIGAKIANAGDLVLNRLKAHLAVFATSPTKGTVSPDYTVLRPMRDVYVRFFEALFRTPIYRAQFFIHTKGIVEGFWRLYTDSFYTIPTICPPQSEQMAIVTYLDTMSAQVARTADRAKREINLIEEYRTRLISDVVTGKLDVRGVDLPVVEEVVDASVELITSEWQPIGGVVEAAEMVEQ